MKTALRKNGEFVGGDHSQADLERAWHEGRRDKIEMALEAGKVILAPIKRHPREGWAEFAKALAEADDDGLVWPEFGKADDEKLVW